MKFRINFEYECGTQDSIVVEGESIEEIREVADEELKNEMA